MKMTNFFNIGERVYGFCNGYFGRDDYDTKLCIMVTSRFALFVYVDGEFEGNAVVLNNPERLDIDMVKEWKEFK